MIILKQCFVLLRIFFIYFSYGKLSLLLSIGIDGTLSKDKNLRKCVSVNIFIYMLYFNLKEVLHTTLFFIQCYIFFKKKKSLSSIFFTVVHYLIFFTNCCPSEIIVFYLLFIKLSQMHRLKCRNCLMFVTTNIRVLYVHWNECVRKKGNSQMCSNCNSTWFMQVF